MSGGHIADPVMDKIKCSEGTEQIRAHSLCMCHATHNIMKLKICFGWLRNDKKSTPNLNFNISANLLVSWFLFLALNTTISCKWNSMVGFTWVFNVAFSLLTSKMLEHNIPHFNEIWSYQLRRKKERNLVFSQRKHTTEMMFHIFNYCLNIEIFDEYTNAIKQSSFSFVKGLYKMGHLIHG